MDSRSWRLMRSLVKLFWDLGSFDGATENAGVENAARAKMQGWKMQEWKMQE